MKGYVILFFGFIISLFLTSTVLAEIIVLHGDSLNYSIRVDPVGGEGYREIKINGTFTDNISRINMKVTCPVVGSMKETNFSVLNSGLHEVLIVLNNKSYFGDVSGYCLDGSSDLYEGVRIFSGVGNLLLNSEEGETLVGFLDFEIETEVGNLSNGILIINLYNDETDQQQNQHLVSQMTDCQP